MVSNDSRGSRVVPLRVVPKVIECRRCSCGINSGRVNSADVRGSSFFWAAVFFGAAVIAALTACAILGFGHHVRTYMAVNIPGAVLTAVVLGDLKPVRTALDSHLSFGAALGFGWPVLAVERLSRGSARRTFYG